MTSFSTWVVPIVACALILARPGSTAAQLVLDANFDHAALKSWSGDLTTINLVGRDNFYGNGQWRWLYFKTTGVQGANPTFSISRNFAGDSTPGLHELQEHEMVYSYDGEHWSFFDNNNLGPVNYTFSNAAPFTQNEVYVAYAIPYSYGRTAAHTQTVLASPWAAPTVSGNANGVIGQSPTGTDDLGRSVPALDLFAYRITNPATDSSTVAKRKIVVSSGLHAGETLGTYTYEGLVDWLISDDPRAARLRDIAEVYGYPVLNPTGRYAGMNRSTVRNPTRDPNGLWDQNRWNSSSFGCGSNNCQDIRESGEAMLADVAATPGGVNAFVDFHSTVPDYTIDPSGRPDDFGYVATADANADWWLELRELQPNIFAYPSGSGDFTTAGYARRRLGAQVEITFETQFTWERNIDYYHNLGANFGIAFYKAWVPQVEGDFTGDGTVDAADYALWRDTLGETGPGLRADADGNGTVDTRDYALWRANFGRVATGNIGATATDAVPEPAAVVGLGLAVLALYWRNIRPKRCTLY